MSKQLREERIMYDEAKTKLAIREQDIAEYLTAQELNYSEAKLASKIRQYILHDKQCKKYRKIIKSFDNKLKYLVPNHE